MRSKLQIEWDLTFNSMYELIISNQMGVIDGRAYRVT